MALDIKLTSFQGPLDLLLHLIEKAEVDIYDIPIVEITDQYMDYLYVMQELQLDIASEFLVMAATLLAIKSKMLLPRREEPNIAEMLEGFEYEEDPRAELVQRLLEYKKFKTMANYLREREIEQSKVYTRPGEDLSRYLPQEEENPVKNVTLYDLMEALQKAFSREYTARVHRDEISITERMAEIQNRLMATGGKIRFSQLISDFFTRVELVTTFLALLELMKEKKVYCYQHRLFDDIFISASREEGI
jgi:segregation and condensation protein A